MISNGTNCIFEPRSFTQGMAIKSTLSVTLHCTLGKIRVIVIKHQLLIPWVHWMLSFISSPVLSLNLFVLPTSCKAKKKNVKINRNAVNHLRAQKRESEISQDVVDVAKFRRIYESCSWKRKTLMSLRFFTKLPLSFFSVMTSEIFQDER
jgi:hypothetical protein